jgi:hypothetical protein
VTLPENQGGDTVELVDDLVHTDTNKGLTANQGKVLKGLIDALPGELFGQNGIHIDATTGNWFIGSTNTGIPATGPQGSVTITDGNLNTLEVHNALNAQTGILGMGGAMKIKNNIDSLAASLDRLYAKLANIAFWSAADQAAAEPTPIDWSVSKKNVTLDLSNVGQHVSVLHGANAVANDDVIQVDEGSDLVLTIVADEGYYIDSLSSSTTGATISGNSVTLPNVTAAATLVITATAALIPQVSVNKTLTGVEASNETPAADIAYNQPYEVTLKRHKYYFPLGTYPNDETLTVTMGGTDITSSAWNASTGKIRIEHVTGEVVITVTAVSYIDWDKGYYEANLSDTSVETGETGNSANKGHVCAVTAYIKIPKDATAFKYHSGGSVQENREELVLYNNSGMTNPDSFFIFKGSERTETQNVSDSTYVRASFHHTNGVIANYASLKFVVDGQDVTVFDASNGIITEFVAELPGNQ